MQRAQKRRGVPRYVVIIHISFILAALIFILPFALIIGVSFSTEADIVAEGYRLIPKTPSLAAYKLVFADPAQVVNSYFVTILSSTVGTLLSIVIVSLAGYSLSREGFTWRKTITFFFFFTMLFSGGLVPSYIINTKYLRLMNTYTVHCVLGLVSAWNILIFRTFFQGLPKELSESALIDGASEVQVYVRIVLPLSKPVFATLTLMTMLGRWNDWTTSLYYITDNRLYSIQYMLQHVLREAEYIENMMKNAPMLAGLSQMKPPTETLRFALCVIAAGPMVAVFPFFQKYFTRGLTIGAVKG